MKVISLICFGIALVNSQSIKCDPQYIDSDGKIEEVICLKTPWIDLPISKYDVQSTKSDTGNGYRNLSTTKEYISDVSQARVSYSLDKASGKMVGSAEIPSAKVLIRTDVKIMQDDGRCFDGIFELSYNINRLKLKANGQVFQADGIFLKYCPKGKEGRRPVEEFTVSGDDLVLATKVDKMKGDITDLYGNPSEIKKVLKIPITPNNKTNGFYSFKTIEYPLSNDDSFQIQFVTKFKESDFEELPFYEHEFDEETGKITGELTSRILRVNMKTPFQSRKENVCADGNIDISYEINSLILKWSGRSYLGEDANGFHCPDHKNENNMKVPQGSSTESPPDEQVVPRIESNGGKQEESSTENNPEDKVSEKIASNDRKEQSSSSEKTPEEQVDVKMDSNDNKTQNVKPKTGMKKLNLTGNPWVNLSNSEYDIQSTTDYQNLRTGLNVITNSCQKVIRNYTYDESKGELTGSADVPDAKFVFKTYMQSMQDRICVDGIYEMSYNITDMKLKVIGEVFHTNGEFVEYCPRKNEKRRPVKKFTVSAEDLLSATEIDRMNLTLRDDDGNATEIKELYRIPIHPNNKLDAFHNFKSIKYPISNEKTFQVQFITEFNKTDLEDLPLHEYFFYEDARFVSGTLYLHTHKVNLKSKFQTRAKDVCVDGDIEISYTLRNIEMRWRGRTYLSEFADGFHCPDHNKEINIEYPEERLPDDEILENIDGGEQNCNSDEIIREVLNIRNPWSNLSNPKYDIHSTSSAGSNDYPIQRTGLTVVSNDHQIEFSYILNSTNGKLIGSLTVPNANFAYKTCVQSTIAGPCVDGIKVRYDITNIILNVEAEVFRTNLKYCSTDTAKRLPVGKFKVSEDLVLGTNLRGRMNATMIDMNGEPSNIKDLSKLPIGLSKTNPFYNFKSIKYPLTNDKSWQVQFINLRDPHEEDPAWRLWWEFDEMNGRENGSMSHDYSRVHSNISFETKKGRTCADGTIDISYEIRNLRLEWSL